MSLDMTALAPEQLVQLLQKAGGKQVSLQTIQTHLAAGAPKNPDGRVHFVHYAAWLAAQVK